MKRNRIVCIALGISLASFSVEAIASVETVRPAAIAGWENFSATELRAMQQEADAGHQPWRQDPAYYAGVLVMAYQKASTGSHIDPSAMEQIAKDLVMKDRRHATVTIETSVAAYIVDLVAPIRPYPDGVWRAEEIRVSDKSI